MNDAAFYKRIANLLVLILFIKIAGFFTMSENIAVTRAIKIILRGGMTFAMYGCYRMLVRRGFNTAISLNNLPVFALYIAYLSLGFVSLYWSSDKGYSLLQLGMNTESLIFSWYFVKTVVVLRSMEEGRQVRLAAILAKSTFLILIAFLAGALIDPSSFYRLTHGGEESRLGGYFMNPNELGMLSVVCAAMSGIELTRSNRRLAWILVMITAVIALLLTGSRSSLVGFVLIVIYLIQKSNSLKVKWAVLAGMVALVPFAVTTIILKQGDLDEVLSMTGRVPFWTALLTEGLPKEPLLGFGYMRIAYEDYFQSVHTYAGQMTHNTFIQVLMNLGLIGLVIVLLQVVMTVIAYVRSSDTEMKTFFVALFVPILINSFTEFGVFGEMNYGVLFYQLLILFPVLSIKSRLTPREEIALKARRKWLDTAS